MPGVTKAAAAGRQTQPDPLRPVVTVSKTQPVKKRSKASSTPKLSADAHDASSCHVIVREATSSRNRSPETIPRPYEKVTTALEKHKSRAAEVTSANCEVSKPLLSDSGPPAAYRSPANPGSVTGPYPFGWDAEPTRARVNEVCRHFLMGQCSFAANCDRIHPRGDGVCKHAPDAQVFVVKLPSQQPPPIPGVRLALQADAVSKVPSDIPRPHTLPLPSGVESGAPLRYDLNRGLLPYQADSDGGQTSDSSQYFSAKSSPVGSSCSLTSEDTETTKAPMHPPPPFIHLCRRWLMNECKRSHDCSFVHGDLEYDPPVRGVYPYPEHRTRCTRRSCSRGYLCEYFHDDLKYGKPFDELPSSKSACGSTDFLPSRPPLDSEATTVQGALKEEKAVVNVGGYPPPKSNHFCRNWLLNRCFRGPACFFFHGDVEYDPPAKGIHPPPRYSHTCKLSLLHECFRGFACDFIHEDLQYDTPKPREALQEPREHPQRSRECLQRDGTRDPGEGKHRRPRFAELCRDWVRNRCQKGYSCHYIHLDLVYDDTPSAPLIRKTSFVDNPANDPPVGMRPPPKSPDTCIQWLRDKCALRYACKYRHDDLDYDPSSDQRSPDVSTALGIAGNGCASTEARAWSVKVHDHAKVKLGPGFEIQELETGFETPWIYLGNIPARATAEDVADLLRPFGEVLDVRLPTRVNNPTMLVRARFLSPADAREAGTSLNGAQAFGCKVSARLPVHDASRHNAMFEDTAVRIRWEAPSKVGYGGYSTMEHAKAALEATRKPFGDHYVHAAVHVGLPVVGVVTVCFRGLPLDTSKEDMAWFAKPDDVVWARPNYRNLDLATQGIKRILQEGTELSDFVVLPPPYRSGARVQAWAHFLTPSDAKAACSRVHGRKPVFTGKTKVFAEHVQSLTFSVSPAMYGKLGDDIQALCRTVYHARRTAMSVVQRPTPMQMLVKLSGDDIKELGQLKAELEKILKGETVRQGQNVAWDPFFAHPAGKAFLEGIEREVPAITVLVDIPKRMIRLLGSSRSRLIVRQRILSKMTELQSQQTHTIPLDGWLLGQFMRNDLAPLQIQFGRENVNLDMRNRRLIIRGSDAAYDAREAVRRARQAQFHPARRHKASECPVCFDEVTSPVTLPCGHSWCRDCFSRYLLSAIDNKFFPVTCLGGDAKCTEHIPLQIARKFLTMPQFDAMVDAALAFYIHSRPDEFHHCPTPDCPQFYRSAPRETVLQCPSCLLRICPSCHVEAHDGFSCPDPEGDSNLFREWMGNHDVKPCPGCKVLIERAEGCHHMTCTQCKTHICWVCLQTFPKGDGIYDHMRALHGGIGLGAD